MQNKKNTIIILTILILPALLFYALKTTQAPKPTTQTTNNQQIQENPYQVLIFSSELCLECQELEKNIKGLREKYKEKIHFEKLFINNKDKATQEKVKKYKIRVVPTTVFIKNGKVVLRFEENKPTEELEKDLKNLIGEKKESSNEENAQKEGAEKESGKE